MSPSFLLTGLTAALAALSPQTALAVSVPASQCPAPADQTPTVSGEPERTELETMRMNQESWSAPLQTSNPAREKLPPNSATLCGQSLATETPNIATYETTPVGEPKAMSDRPDIFGSTALPVSHPPLYAKWRSAYGMRLSVHSVPWASLISTISRQSRLDRLQAVNMWVNTRVRFAGDRTSQGSADQWASASQTLMRGTGDCEDYAIAKMKLLSAAGIPQGDMYLVVVKDLVRRADHALLVVRLNDQFLVLDNSTNQLLDARNVSDYRPIFSFGEKGAWVHGYAERSTQVATAF